MSNLELLDGRWIVPDTVDELLTFQNIPLNNNQNLVFDFKGLKRISSYGIRSWVKMIRSIAAKKMVYMNCPSFFIEQLNLVPALKGGAEIDSFFLPYYCDKCNIESEHLTRCETVGNDDFIEKINNSVTCPKCKKHMMFGDDPELFFLFL